MEIIAIDFEQSFADAKKLSELAGNINNRVVSLAKDTADMAKSAWKGESGRIFAQKSDKFVDFQMEIVHILEEVSQEYDQMVRKYIVIEKSAQTRFGKLI